jgi:glucose-1-phosphate adenylyltransferase
MSRLATVLRKSLDFGAAADLVPPPRAASRCLASDSTAIVLAGGRGERLRPLTIGRAKPAVPFGGTHRILDFTIANCVSSGVPRIHLLTQYQSVSIETHVRRAWRWLNRRASCIDIRPADLLRGADGYRGTADAVLQNLDLIERVPARFVLVLGGDHVYRMDYQELLASHARSGAELTIAATEVSLADARRMGVLAVDERWRIRAFDEKPSNPRPTPGRLDVALASMGIYAFDPGALLRELRARRGEARDLDFGKDVIPAMVRRGARVHAFPFRDASGRPRYWRDIGTLDSYFAASMDVASARALAILTVAPRTPIQDTMARRSIVESGAVVETGAVVEEAVLFDSVRVGPGASIRRAILDEGVQVRAGARVGLDLEKETRRFIVTDGGVVVVPPGTVVAV